MKKRSKSFFAQLSVKAWLECLFAVVSIIPVLAIGYISISTFSSTMQEKGVQESQSRLEFIEYRTVEIMRQKHYETLITAFNENIRLYFDTDAGAARENIRLIEDQAKRQLISLYNGQEATSVALISFDGSGLRYDSSQSSAVRPLEAAATSPDMSQFHLFDRWGEPTYADDQAVIPYERLVLGMDNQPVAKLIVYCRESIFRSLYADYVQEGGSAFYILNAAGQIVSSSERSTYAKDAAAEIGFLPESLEGEEGYHAEGGYTYVYKTNAKRGLYFIERIPESQLKSGMHSILLSTALVALLCIIVCAVLGSLIARSFTQPLYRLIERIRPLGAQEGLDRAAGKNEIAILSDQYGKIVERLETLIAEYYDEQRKKKEAEIRALEFQINPHFLYNTLSTIVWLIDANERKDAIRITKGLASFFRISISKGRDFIRIAEELRHVELYIDIQKARYDGIDYHSDVPAEILAHYTPKLILQPLVENSIIHAMQTRPDKKCTIAISAAFAGGDILFEVRDNGISATAETIASMNRFLNNRDEPRSASYGIGISNVHDRVKMCFGEGYGLYYRRENEQTVAIVRIKAVPGGEFHV